MSKVFNVTGACDPRYHYMADIRSHLEEIKKMIDKGAYFTINRARQYGKTTTLKCLCRYLKNDYYTVFMDFQNQMSNAKFRNENVFSIAFAKAFLAKLKTEEQKLSNQMEQAVLTLQKEMKENKEELELVELFLCLSNICKAADKPVVLIIDEVDSAANNQVFLDFLAQLRGYYLDREETATFQSVILSGVYDVKNIKWKIRPEDEHKHNSPWNIAADFEVVMSLSKQGITGMLSEYEEEHGTGMEIEMMAGLLYEYTSGYPFLVSRLCMLIEKKVPECVRFQDLKSAWTKDGFLEAVKLILLEKNALFESLMGKIQNYPQLERIVYAILLSGEKPVYNPDDTAVDIAQMFGFIKNENGNIVIANRIFEMRLYNYFLTRSDAQNSEIFRAASSHKNQYIQNGHLNMNLVLEKFVEHFNSIYSDKTEKFDEEEGRRRFLLYLRPIINGTGNYYIEAETRDARRMDIVVDYLGERFVIELKIWRGSAYNERGEKQLMDYLDYFHLKKGYLLSYNFNKNKEIGVKELHIGDRILIEAVV
jgi:hypothetical protein